MSFSLNKNCGSMIPILDSPCTYKAESGMIGANKAPSQAMRNNIYDRNEPLPKLFMRSFFGVIQVNPTISSNLFPKRWVFFICKRSIKLLVQKMIGIVRGRKKKNSLEASRT